jgi:hypothetical protein
MQNWIQSKLDWLKSKLVVDWKNARHWWSVKNHAIGLALAYLVVWETMPVLIRRKSLPPLTYFGQIVAGYAAWHLGPADCSERQECLTNSSHRKHRTLKRPLSSQRRCWWLLRLAATYEGYRGGPITTRPTS